MPQTKNSNSKTPKKAPARRVEAPEEENTDSDVASFLGKKTKKEIDLDEEEALPSADKLEDAVIGGEVAVEEENSEDEEGLDDDEIDPFKDKWEE